MNTSLAKNFNMKTLIAFAFPNMIMMIFLSLYTIIDGMFISGFVGTDALSATNMVYPVTSIEMAFSIMIATGGSAIIAKKLGEGRQKEARSILTALTILTAVLGVIIAVLSIVFLKPIVYLMGASQVQFGYCVTYLGLLSVFVPFFLLETMFQIFFVTAGRPGLGLIVTMSAGITNIVLDYIFMGPLKMGVAGAAVATGIGHVVVAVCGIVFFAFSKNNSVKFFKPDFNFKVIIRAMLNGSSEMVTNTATAVTTFLFNYEFLKFYGEDGVAAITIVMYFQFVFTSVFFGYANGVAPVISFKYGMQDIRQLKSIYRHSMIFIIVCSVGIFALSILSIGSVLKFFTSPDSGVYSLTLHGFKIYATSFIIMGVSIYASSLFTAFSDGLVSAVISFARTFIFLVGTVTVLPVVLGREGVWLAVPAAEAMGLAVAVFFLISKHKKYNY